MDVHTRLTVINRDQPGMIGISSPNVSAGGSTSLQIVLQQSDGTLYAQNASITFNSPCAAQNLATITSPVQTSTGIASATYSASGCSGSALAGNVRLMRQPRLPEMDMIVDDAGHEP